MTNTKSHRKRTIIILIVSITCCLTFIFHQTLRSHCCTEYLLSVRTPARRFVESDELIVDIKARCSDLNMTTNGTALPKGSKRNPRLLIVARNIAYASNPKTGSTSFKKFLRMYATPKDRFAMWYNNSQLPPVFFEEHVVVGFIRNPMIRLISGFRDKVLRRNAFMQPGKEWGPEEYPASASENEVFHHFLSKMLSETEHNNWRWNRHFSPQYRAMAMCQFPYGMLGQVEHSTRDIQFMQELTNTTHIIFPGSRTERGMDKESSVALAKRYWSNASTELLDAVYKHYAMDFGIFGYPKLHEDVFPYITKESS